VGGSGVRTGFREVRALTDTGLAVHGPRSASVHAPLTVLPYFFRCGTDPFASATRHRPVTQPPAPTAGLG
jgi:hypothetical protein